MKFRCRRLLLYYQIFHTLMSVIEIEKKLLSNCFRLRRAKKRGYLQDQPTKMGLHFLLLGDFLNQMQIVFYLAFDQKH